MFDMLDGREIVVCIVSNIALDELAPDKALTHRDREEMFRAYRPVIERAAAIAWEAGDLANAPPKIWVTHDRLSEAIRAGVNHPTTST